MTATVGRGPAGFWIMIPVCRMGRLKKIGKSKAPRVHDGALPKTGQAVDRGVVWTFEELAEITQQELLRPQQLPEWRAVHDGRIP